MKIAILGMPQVGNDRISPSGPVFEAHSHVEMQRQSLQEPRGKEGEPNFSRLRSRASCEGEPLRVGGPLAQNSKI